MTEEAAPSVAELDALLLDAKTMVPQARPGSVSRTDLITRARASGCRVVGVTAPAGYGKSTLLAEWARAEDRRVAWVSLDRFDDDPGVLLALLASAYAQATTNGDELIADMRGLGVSVLGRAAPRLAAAFRTSADPFVLMLDDLHQLQSPACHDALGVVMAGIPADSQLVAASRFEQPHLPRLRVSGDAFEIESPDLALDSAGAAHIFAAADVAITPEAATAVTERTEGWPVGLYLAALIARETDGETLSVAGDDRYVADYLYRESLTQLPERTQQFLRRSAVPDQLCAPLCDALLGDTGAHDELHKLAASNMFLVPLDRRRGWYRYHALFREFLLTELRRVEPDLVEKLNLRAADWYEANGSPGMAVEHLLDTSERDRCIQLVTALSLPTYKAGHISTVYRWLTALGDDAIESYPPLAVLAGWITSLSGDIVRAQRLAAVVDAASYDLVPLDGSASFDSARAMWRAFMCPAGPENMLLDAKLALEQEPPWSPWRDNALVIGGEAYLLSGDVDRAAALFTESSALAALNSNTDSLVLSESELASLAIDRGQWSQAAEHLERAQTTIEEHRLDDYASCLFTFVGSARLALHRGDRAETERQLTRAMRARVSLTFLLSFLSVRVRLHLAKMYWALGDQTTARHLLREIDDILLHRPRLGTLLDEVSTFRDAIASSAQRPTAGASPLTPAELRLLPYLQTHLTLREVADRLFVSRNTVSSELSSIYRKFGVSSRGAAVEHATAVGLLGA